MARMIPNTMQDDNASYGEKEVFEALKTKLGSEYVVFHSVRWNDIYAEKRTIWGESDFTVFHPQKGIIVIEVKSGGVECDGNTWTYVRTDNNERYSMKNPLKQADKSKYRFVELLEDLFEDNGYAPKMKCQVEPAVWFPSVSSRTDIGSMPMEFHEEIVLLENALDDPETFIDRIYEFYSMKKFTYLTADCAKAVVDTFAPHFRAVASLNAKRKEQKDLFFRLTEEQNALINYLEEQKIAAIQGAAGTGKTVLACEKAKVLAKDGKVLFLCYNQFLRKALQEEKELNPEKYENVDFFNIHQLVSSKIKATNVDDEDIDDYFDIYTIDDLKKDIVSRTNENPFPVKTEIDIPLYGGYTFKELVIEDGLSDTTECKNNGLEKLFRKHYSLIREEITNMNLNKAKWFCDFIDESKISDKSFRANFIYMNGLISSFLNQNLNMVLEDFEKLEEEFPKITEDKNYIHNKNYLNYNLEKHNQELI